MIKREGGADVRQKKRKEDSKVERTKERDSLSHLYLTVKQ